MAALGLSVLVCWLAAPSAQAVPEHSFDATLSLEGGCAGKDGVPDPGCPGGQHPPISFDDSCGVAVDRHGYIYAASPAIANGTGTGGRIDVFDPEGKFLTEIKDEHQPCSLAVDSEGNLYVAEFAIESKNAVLFEPKSYPPKRGGIHLDDRLRNESSGLHAWTVAVDPSNDHLYAGARVHDRRVRLGGGRLAASARRAGGRARRSWRGSTWWGKATTFT